jgi:two-component system response regulator
MMPRSVLLVEDNIDDAYLTKRTLRKAGIDEVKVAGDGQEALDTLLSSAEPLPELLILDLRLPKVHGLKLFAEIRRNKRTMALPVLILSSSEDPRDRETCLKLGAIAFLNKPLDLNSFQQVLA